MDDKDIVENVVRGLVEKTSREEAHPAAGSPTDPNGDTIIYDCDDEEDDSLEEEDFEDDDPSQPSTSYRPRIVPNRRRKVQFAKKVHEEVHEYLLAKKDDAPSLCVGEKLGERFLDLKRPQEGRYQMPPRITEEQLKSAVESFFESGGKSSSELPDFTVPEPFPRGCGEVCVEDEDCGEGCACHNTDILCSKRNGCKCSKSCPNRMKKREKRKVSDSNEKWKDMSFSDNSTLKSVSSTSSVVNTAKTASDEGIVSSVGRENEVLPEKTLVDARSDMSADEMELMMIIRSTIADMMECVVRISADEDSRTRSSVDADLVEEGSEVPYDSMKPVKEGNSADIMYSESMENSISSVVRSLIETVEKSENVEKTGIFDEPMDIDPEVAKLSRKKKASDPLSNDSKRQKLSEDECDVTSVVDSQVEFSETLPLATETIAGSSVVMEGDGIQEIVEGEDGEGFEPVAVMEQIPEEEEEECESTERNVVEMESDEVYIDQMAISITGSIEVFEPERIGRIDVENSGIGSEKIDEYSGNAGSSNSVVEIDMTIESDQLEVRMDDSDVVEALLSELVESVDSDVGHVEMREVDSDDHVVEEDPIVVPEDQVEEMVVEYGDLVEVENDRVVDDEPVIAEVLEELIVAVEKEEPIPLRRSSRVKRPIDRFTYDENWIPKRRRYSNRVPNPTPIIRRPRIQRPTFNPVVFVPRIRLPLPPPPPPAVALVLTPNASPMSSSSPVGPVTANYLDESEKRISKALLKLESFNYGNRGIDVLLAIRRITTTLKRLRKSQIVSDHDKSRFLRAVAKVEAML